MGEQKFGVEHNACHQIALSIKEVHALGIQIGLVVGGGNIFRGNQAEAFGFARTPADHIGMLSTVINGLVLQQALAAIGVESRVMSAFHAHPFIEPYHWVDAIKFLTQGIIVIFVGGTGNPYFTTDSAAALRASEMEAEILLKATKVDGIYDKDPVKYPHAQKFTQLSYSEVLSKNLQVMDSTAIALCRENQIPICVFNLFEPKATLRAVCGESTGTLVKGD